LEKVMQRPILLIETKHQDKPTNANIKELLSYCNQDAYEEIKSSCHGLAQLKHQRCAWHQQACKWITGC